MRGLAGRGAGPFQLKRRRRRARLQPADGLVELLPETTGYIIPTMIALARRTDDEELHGRARRMLDWCVAIQFAEGGFQGGKIDSTPRVPVTFNTGQILLGLAAGVQAYGAAYADAMHRAARWLRDSQDADGCWRRHPTPFASAGDKAYETHVAWGLFEADRVAPGLGYGAAGLRQVDWALGKQRANGWFASNCLDNPLLPLSHTIGYVLRGLLEAHRFAARADLLDAAARRQRASPAPWRPTATCPDAWGRTSSPVPAMPASPVPRKMPTACSSCTSARASAATWTRRAA
jgi:hypothetical protein